MNKKQSALTALACTIPFLFLLARGTWIGYDTYAYTSTICTNHAYGAWINSPLFKETLNLIPCNFQIMTLLQLTALLIIAFAWAKIGEKTLGEKGWQTGILTVTLTPAIFLLAGTFEKSLFAYALNCIGLLLFTLALHQESKTKKIILLILSAPAFIIAYLFWEASALMIATALLITTFWWLSIPILALALIPLITYSLSSFTALINNQAIAEEAPIIGIVFIAHLLKPLKTAPKKLVWPALLLLAIGLIKIKYMFLCVPFFVMAYLNQEKPIKIVFIETNNTKALAAAGIILWSLMLFFSAPQPDQIQLIKEGIQLSKDTNTPLYNDWSIGWWVTYQGYDTNYKSSYPNPDWNQLKKPFTALTQIDLNCTKIKKAGQLTLQQC